VIISVASGKGGTGKTTIAASLALSIKDSMYIDCDVEEPNGHILLKPEFSSAENVYKQLPEINEESCRHCKKCLQACEFNALINLGFKKVVLDELCHSCGACWFVCPWNAIAVREKEIGVIRTGIVNNEMSFIDGTLNIGEASAVPLIHEVKKKINDNKIIIIDSPPGTSCSMLEAVRKSDYCLLVTESSPFGLNDLKLAIEVADSAGVPYGVVINKYEPAFCEMESFLASSGIEILMKIPFNRQYAELYSEGILPITRYPELKKEFVNLYSMLTTKSLSVNAG